MPKFMIKASYNAGAKGLVKEGGTGRRAAVLPTSRAGAAQSRRSISPLVRTMRM